MALRYDGPIVEAVAVGDRKYNVVGYAFVLISFIGTMLSEAVGAGPDTFWGPIYALLVAMPIPIAAFGAFRARIGHSGWAAVLAFMLIAGTSLRPVLTVCKNGDLYDINHAIAVTGLLILAADLLGRRRIWPAAIGLALAVWSRQMTCFYAIPILWLAWRPQSSPGRSAGQSTTVHSQSTGEAGLGAKVQNPAARSRLSLAIFGVAMVAALPMTMSFIKLGNPLDSGYPQLYGDRENQISVDGRTQLWGFRWYPRHLVAMNATVPDIDMRNHSIYFDNTDREGCSIWVSSPILLAVFLTAGRWWRDPASRVLMLSSFVVILGLWGYHTTASYQAGFYRYSLDFIPIWLMVIAPHVMTKRATPWTLAAMAWSALYFHTLTP